MLVLQSLAGLAIIPLLAWSFSESRTSLPIGRLAKLCATGIGLQFAIAVVFIVLPQSKVLFAAIVAAVAALQAATNEGMKFLFGYLAGAEAPFPVRDPSKGFVLALQALPLILLMSVLSSLFYYWGLLQRVVAFFAWILRRTMGIGGAVGTAAAANIFVGMVEAPLFVRPYIAGMSRGGVFAMMTTGMATVAGTVMALYASFLEPVVPGAAGHILVASIMSAPAALLIARIMVPWEEARDEADRLQENALRHDAPTSSVMDAIARGTADGIRLLVSIAAMLVVMVALVALANMVLGAASSPFGIKVTIERVFGWAMAPAALLAGIPWSEAASAGEYLGVKTVLNELLAYARLAQEGNALSPRTRLILLYALCGFANFGSLGIMTGGLLAMCPERRAEILSLGPKSLVSGTLATLMTGAVVGALTWP
ncbi:MAG: NupC/NupG family nucleoside CNT transporter [Beijerinckiaceae bacterium]